MRLLWFRWRVYRYMRATGWSRQDARTRALKEWPHA